MRYFFYILLFCITGTYAEARVPVMVTQTQENDVYVIEDPTLSQAFYGSMDNMPHTYEVYVREPTNLSLQVLVPDINESSNNISGIIVKRPKLNSRVEEVARIMASSVEWTRVYDYVGGDSYRYGPSFKQVIEPGEYIIQVFTPDNVEKYVLTIGTREEMTISYFELLRRTVAVKMFFNKSPLLAIQSTYVYVPLLTIVAIVGLIYGVRRRNKTT